MWANSVMRSQAVSASAGRQTNAERDDKGGEHRLGDLVERRGRLGSNENGHRAAHDHAGDGGGKGELGPHARERISHSGSSGHGR